MVWGLIEHPTSGILTSPELTNHQMDRDQHDQHVLFADAEQFGEFIKLLSQDV